MATFHRSVPSRAALSVAAFAIGLAMAVATSAADARAQDPDDNPMEGGRELELREIPDIEHGRAVILEGEARSQGDRFFVENLQITQPVSVVLMAADPAEPLVLNLSKYRYDESDRRGETGEEGAVNFDFRTQGELKIHVTPGNAAEGRTTPYYLVVWAGDDAEPSDLPPPAVVATASLARGNGLPTWAILLLALGLGAAVFAARQRLRGGRPTALILLLAGSALAAPETAAAQARQLGSLSDLRGAADARAREAEQAGVDRDVRAESRKGIDAGLGHLNTALGLYEASRGFTEADWNLDDVLNPDDLEFDPDYQPPGAPDIPVHCDVAGGEDCRQCYSDAYKTVNFVRFYMEKLRAIYGATRNYTENAIAFGDAMAGLPGGFGLGWPPERKGIQDAFENLGRTYDDKYEGYLRELREGLEEVAACEVQSFDNPDWYNRFGFMYYEFMAERYRR